MTNLLIFLALIPNMPPLYDEEELHLLPVEDAVRVLVAPERDLQGVRGRCVNRNGEREEARVIAPPPRTSRLSKSLCRHTARAAAAAQPPAPPQKRMREQEAQLALAPQISYTGILP